MFADQRREEILTFLKKQESVSVNYLTDTFNVSPATIRADLNFLDNKKLLTRTHGGAIRYKENEPEPIDKDYDIRKEKKQHEKKLIARKAVELIHDGDCIILDASSTCYELARLLFDTPLKITVVTNGLRTASLLKENSHITVIIIGGMVKSNSNAIEGLLGVELLDKISIDRAFVSAYAIKLKDGLLDFSLYEVELKKLLIKSADSVVALVDSSKFEKSSIASFATIADVNLLITDASLSPELVKQYQATTTVVSA